MPTLSAKKLFPFLLLSALALPCWAQELWVNEFHYDNAGGDTGEFVEIVVADSLATPAADIELVLYNGNGGSAYATQALDTFTAATVPGFTIYSREISGIQNGAPDGMALVENGTVVEFLSYEGEFTASGGPADGLTSTDIGVSEPGDTPVGQSLQLAGNGSSAIDFTWQAPAAATPGAVNTGQSLQLPTPFLNEILISNSGADAEFFELVGAGGFELSSFDLIALDAAGAVALHIDLTGAIPADGFWTAASPTAEATFGVTGDQAIADNTFSNDSRTYLLVESFSGTVGDDLDTNDDGTLDSAPWTLLADALAVIGDDDPLVYAGEVVGPNDTFLAAGAFRCPDVTGDWAMHGFFDFAQDGTPGAANNCSAVLAPEVIGTDPADGAAGVPVSTTLTVDFDQAIDAQEGAVSLTCGATDIVLSGLPVSDTTQLVLVPQASLPAAASCQATLTASLVENQDGIALAADFAWSFDTEIGVVEIFQIQGSGPASPFAGQVVTTEANVVTAVGPNGFFMQTPDARADGEVDTSDGIFVFTGGAPAVAAGDQVDVTGEVIEFFDFTEFSNGPTVSVTGSAPLPAPLTFDAAVPSRDPEAPSCALEFECYEGMRIDLPEAVVGQGNQSFGSEPLAEVSIRAGSQRAFREPGVEFPGAGGGIPVWDGNPELFELSPAALGLPELALFGGTRVQATGVLAFSFGDYELWPTSLDIVEAPAVPRAAPASDPGRFQIGSINLLRLFNATDDSGSDDFVEDPAVYAERVQRFAGHVVEQMRAPAIVGVQEIENIQTLQDLADEIADLDPNLDYSAQLVEGNDVGGIDVGYLVGDDVMVQRVEQLGADETLEFDGSLLHDRPPLLLEASIGDGTATLEFNLLVVHNRSLNGIETTRVKAKRLAQAQSIGQMVQGLQTAEPDQPTVVLGDFNAFEFSDGFVDVVGQIAGTADEAENEFWEAPVTSPALEVSTLSLPANERYSFVFRGNAQTLDHALFSQAAVPHLIATAYTRGNSDAPEAFVENPPAGQEDLGMTDHDSLVVTLSVIAEVLFADGFESAP